jgi:hypothetical protein
LAAALLIAEFVGLLATPALAFAAGTGTFADPVVLPSIPFVATGTLVAPRPNQKPEFWYTVPIAKKQTVEATLTADSAVGSARFIFDSWSFTTPMRLWSDPLSSSVSSLFMLAPVDGVYYFRVFGDYPGTFTLDATNTASVAYQLSAIGVPKKKVSHKKSFTVSVTLRPDYDGLTLPVRFYIERWSGHKWRTFTHVTADKVKGTAAYSTFYTNMRIAKKGSFRIKARFLDVANPTPTYTLPRKVTVK